ncbi:pentapeptide repeat-containing protein [Chromobacterium subtsugae]|uniref:pentapeptide repeat-containing protein n=1 Tax=Chromobacterium subtsugae TaxID=251747 RepID=UPI0009BBF036
MIPSHKKNLQKLAIFHKKIKKQVIKNKFYSKSHCFRATLSNVKLTNVNFKGAILTKCSFKQSQFVSVDFLGTNLKGSNFTDATFKRCIFVGTLLDRANFKGCSFKNCYFVNTNLSRSKNLAIDSSNIILNNYPKFDISLELSALVSSIWEHPNIHYSRVLRLKGGRVNHLTLNILLNKYGEHGLIHRLQRLGGELPCRVVTAHSLCWMIDEG